MPLFNWPSIICSPGQALGTNSSESRGGGREHHSLTELLETGRHGVLDWRRGLRDSPSVGRRGSDLRAVRAYLIDRPPAVAVLLRGGNPEQGFALLEVLATPMSAWLLAGGTRNVCGSASFEPSQFEPIGPALPSPPS